MDNFRAEKTWVLIATDVISRGMDFKGVNCVINYDFPESATAYIHRIGMKIKNIFSVHIILIVKLQFSVFPVSFLFLPGLLTCPNRGCGLTGTESSRANERKKKIQWQLE